MGNGNAGGSLRRFYIVFGVVAAIGLVAVGWSIASHAMGQAAMEPVSLEGTEDLRRLTEMAIPVSMGREDAPVTLLVFEDYLCSHCAVFSLQEKPQLVSEYVDSGKVRLVYYDFVLNPSKDAGDFVAARAARCANDQGRFWEYQNQLFRNQLTWGAARDKIGMLEDYAEGLGLDMDQFKSCLNSDRHAREVTANTELAHSLGLGGTPAVLIGTGQGMSRHLSNYAFSTIRAAVDSLLQETAGQSAGNGGG